MWAGTSLDGDPRALACRGAHILAMQHRRKTKVDGNAYKAKEPRGEFYGMFKSM